MLTETQRLAGEVLEGGSPTKEVFVQDLVTATVENLFDAGELFSAGVEAGTPTSPGWKQASVLLAAHNGLFEGVMLDQIATNGVNPFNTASRQNLLNAVAAISASSACILFLDADGDSSATREVCLEEAAIAAFQYDAAGSAAGTIDPALTSLEAGAFTQGFLSEWGRYTTRDPLGDALALRKLVRSSHAAQSTLGQVSGVLNLNQSPQAVSGVFQQNLAQVRDGLICFENWYPIKGSIRSGVEDNTFGVADCVAGVNAPASYILDAFTGYVDGTQAGALEQRLFEMLLARAMLEEVLAHGYDLPALRSKWGLSPAEGVNLSDLAAAMAGDP